MSDNNTLVLITQFIDEKISEYEYMSSLRCEVCYSDTKGKIKLGSPSFGFCKTFEISVDGITPLVISDLVKCLKARNYHIMESFIGTVDKHTLYITLSDYDEIINNYRHIVNDLKEYVFTGKTVKCVMDCKTAHYTIYVDGSDTLFIGCCEKINIKIINEVVRYYQHSAECQLTPHDSPDHYELTSTAR